MHDDISNIMSRIKELQEIAQNEREAHQFQIANEVRPQDVNEPVQDVDLEVLSESSCDDHEEELDDDDDDDDQCSVQVQRHESSMSHVSHF